MRKTKKELETLIQTVRIYSQDIGMEFGIEKCTLLVTKSGKRHMTEGVELPNQEKIRTLGEKETNKYLKILESDTTKQAEMKEKNLKKSISEEQESYSRQNSIARTLSKGIYSCAVSLVRYSGPFLRWTREELKTNGTQNKKTNDQA